MNRRTLLTGLAALPLAHTAAAAATQQASIGTTILRSFASAPFPHPSRANGHAYQGKLYSASAAYSDGTVGLFIPHGFKPGAATDFIVHFHGWNNDVATVLSRYRLREQVASSGRNAILVVPQGPRDAPDSGDGKLELDKDGFARFMHDVASFLQSNGTIPAANVGRIVLSAHSGGYGGAGGVLTNGGLNASITDVVLFDAAYGYFDAFASWQKATPGNHFLSLFTDDTSTGNTALMAMMQTAAPNIFVRLADTMTLAQLQTRAPSFVLTTKVAHDELLQKYGWYALFLQATALAAR
ncbi:MAG: hypothetical protein M3R35_06215 [Candidatus Eremiobacteraeota bacterium]|nr:hypothetical protein [Candidatus Eremiobacteraeota bacterium]